MNSIDIIIPVYNEEKYIEEVLEKLDSVDFCGLKKNIIVVDDCSIDSTRDILKNYENKHKIIYKEKNGGKGSAVSLGINNSCGDIVLIQDADLEYDPNDYVPLVSTLLKSDYDVVYGSRFLDEKKNNFILLSYLANKFLTGLCNLLYGLNLTDIESCYKAIKREKLKNIKIKSRKFDLEPEITAKLAKNGAKFTELPITYNARSYQMGKKITFKDGIIAVITLFKYRFFD